MAAVFAAASYYRGGVSLCLTGSVRRVMVPGGSKFHLEPIIIHSCWNLTGNGCFDALWISRKLHSVRFVIEGGGVMFSALIPPV